MASPAFHSASRIIGAGCFWVVSVACGVAYVAATTDFTASTDPRGFDGGVAGMKVDNGMVAVISTVSLLGFILAQAVVPRFSSAMSPRFYLLSSVAGVSSLMGSQIVGWVAMEIPYGTRIRWFDYFEWFMAGGQVALAFIISALILLSGYWIGFIRRS